MDNLNIYKKFRGVEQLANTYTISKRFDEPTYFSFRLQFASNADDQYNTASNAVLYDKMPHPLFDLGKYTDQVTTGFITENTNYQIEPESYSAYQYLVDANEPTRAEMLKEFVQNFNIIQHNYPYYFQQIDGISELIKTDPTRGQRIGNDKKITVTCLEALDLRMSHLMNLYRKIVWDDVYQRWILPDMMRYFTLKIYLSEFRTFHQASSAETKQVNPFDGKTIINTTPNIQIEPVLQQQPVKERIFGNAEDITRKYLNILDDILPTWLITCEMCEFDLTDITFTQLNDLNVAADPAQVVIKFGIKIGNIKETQIYPVFKNAFLADTWLNNKYRSGDFITTQKDMKYEYPAQLMIAQTRESGANVHVSGGLPFNENANSTTMYGQGGPGADKMWGTPDDHTVDVDPTRPETWVGNAVKFGKSYASNWLNQKVDKAKMMSIPGLGVSFNEVKSALEAKDIIGAFGLIRKGVNEVIQSYGDAPSSRLVQPIQTDRVMTEFLTEITKSEATDDDQKLQSFANLALSNKGVWQQITDYSLATNLIGQGEVNTEAKISPADLNQIPYTSLPVQGGGIPKVSPNAASSGKITGEKLSTVTPSSQLSENITDELSSGVASERLGTSTEGNQLERNKASERLEDSIQDNVEQIKASERLGTSTEGNKLNQIKASEQLKSKITDGNEQIKASSLLSSNITDNLQQTKPSELLSSNIGNKTEQIKASSLLSSTTQSGGVMNAIPSSKLSDKIESQKIQTEEPNIRTTNIDLTKVIEYDPTSIMYKKLEGEQLKQPEVSKATNSKLESTKLE